MQTIAEIPRDRRALVLIPGSVNYFYNLSGRRIAEAAADLGYHVDVATLKTCPDLPYQWCAFSNVPEILHDFGDEAGGLRKLREMADRCERTASLAIDCVATPWYRRLSDLSIQAGATAILDLGLHDQSEALDQADRSRYRFLFSGLTPSETRDLTAGEIEDADRVIPWAFVGHVTPYRAALVDHLVQEVDPEGFAYLPNLAPYTETGSPHLNQAQFEAVLRKTRYQVWCSHHPFFYMEPERFRTSFLTGGVPIKIVERGREEVPDSVPFADLIVTEAELSGRLREGDFEAMRVRFRQEWLRMPSLARGIARFLADEGLTARPNSPLARAG